MSLQTDPEPTTNGDDYSSMCQSSRENETDPLGIRKHYKKYTEEDRERIVSCAERGDDWAALAVELGINYKTAFSWLRPGSKKMIAKILNELQIEVIIAWIEENGEFTLTQIKEKILENFHQSVSVTAIANYLEGRLFTLKEKRAVPSIGIKSEVQRSEYLQTLNTFKEQHKEIIWIGETNFNLFYRRIRGRLRAAVRADDQGPIPAARGPNLHILGAISTKGVITMKRRRGPFTSELANVWVTTFIHQWLNMGNQMSDLVIIADSATCYSKLETVITGTTILLLRLENDWIRTNPIEMIWTKIRAHAKNNIRTSNIKMSDAMERRMVYLEEIIDEAKNTISESDCAMAIQEASNH